MVRRRAARHSQPSDHRADWLAAAAGPRGYNGCSPYL